MKPILKYYLEIADNAAILSHRLAENSSNGPFLEEDLACTNTALDLIGWAEPIYNEAAKFDFNIKSGDDLAYRRNEWEYFNCNLVEQENRDFAYIMTRQFFMDVYHYYFFTELTSSSDHFLRDVATKSLKEVIYHLKRSSEWMIRFGQGTDVSQQKAQNAIKELWKYTEELFIPSAEDIQLREKGISADLSTVESNWNQKVSEIFYFAQLKKGESTLRTVGLGKNGEHTDKLGFILTELQYLPLKYPDAKW